MEKFEIVKLVVYVIGMLWASATGSVEAILWSKKAADAFKFNEHIVLVVQRFFVLLLVVIPYLFADLIITRIGVLCLFFAVVLGFSFFHNGSYFETRRRIDVPAYRFWSNSESSTAVFEFNFVTRTVMFVLSLILLFI